MNDHPQLDSAAAVKVAAFCWPVQRWIPQIKGLDGARTASPKTEYFTLHDFNDLHRAAAVLVGRGHGRVLDKHFTDLWPMKEGDTDAEFTAWMAAAPADAWARAILQTVREICEQASYTPSAQEIAQDDQDE